MTTYTDFRDAIRARESSGNYGAVNSFGYLGAYQFGEAALLDLNYVVSDGNAYDNVISGWTGKNGVTSVAGFLSDPAAQDAAADEWFALLWNYAEYYGLDAYTGQYVDGIWITASSIIAGAHLVGIGNMKTWLESGGSATITDGLGTPVEDYLEEFSGYPMYFDTGEAPGDLTPPPSGVIRDGGDGFDLLLGSALDDELSGGGGTDVLIGSEGGDSLNGGDGLDFIDGGDGRDEIAGGAGFDVLTGGAGTDLFIFDDMSGTDLITDYDASPTGDVIVLSDVSGITDYQDLVDNHLIQLGNIAFIFDGDGTTIIVTGDNLDQLNEGDFVF